MTTQSSGDPAKTEYAHDNAWRQARERLAHLERCLDPATTRRLTSLGVAPGWSCLEAGAGGGSTAEWLCRQVGPSGQVVATDIDPRFLEAIAAPNLEVRRHNLVTDPLPEATFDLVHTRLVLMHIPEREQLVTKLITALKPGGWLLLEEHDRFPVTALAAGLYGDIWMPAIRAVEAFGSCLDWARCLPGLLAAAGLREVGSEGDVPFFPGASSMAEFWRLTWVQLREAILKAGAREPDLDQVLQDLADPAQHFVGPCIVAAWGRRPAA